jgi:hypothetical protein
MRHLILFNSFEFTISKIHFIIIFCTENGYTFYMYSIYLKYF